MLPIHEKIKVNGIYYWVEDVENGYLVTSENDRFIIYSDGDKWSTEGKAHADIVQAIGSKIDDLIWFRAGGL